MFKAQILRMKRLSVLIVPKAINFDLYLFFSPLESLVRIKIVWALANGVFFSMSEGIGGCIFRLG